MSEYTIGATTITAVEDTRTPQLPPDRLFSTFDDREWRKQCARFEGVPQLRVTSPDFIHQSWILRSEGKTILVDTSVGNHKSRPLAPNFDQLETSYLDHLASAGVNADDVDVVVNTHIHLDHVGWNTIWESGAWAPTFPNATYVMPQDDVIYFDPAREAALPRRSDAFMLNVFEDSIAPILERGKALLWRGSHQLTRDVRLEAAPGHTPGNAVLKVECDAGSGVIVGDMLHSVAQVGLPHWAGSLCEDPAASIVSRLATLEWAAETSALVFPAHFGAGSAVTVQRQGSTYAAKLAS